MCFRQYIHIHTVLPGAIIDKYNEQKIIVYIKLGFNPQLLKGQTCGQ